MALKRCLIIQITSAEIRFPTLAFDHPALSPSASFTTDLTSLHDVLHASLIITWPKINVCLFLIVFKTFIMIEVALSIKNHILSHSYHNIRWHDTDYVTRIADWSIQIWLLSPWAQWPDKKMLHVLKQVVVTFSFWRLLSVSTWQWYVQ